MSGRGRWGLLLVAGLLVVAAAVRLLPSGRAGVETGRTDREPAPAIESPAAAVVDDARAEPAPTVESMPDGALGQLLGEPDEDRIPFCDERNWSRVDEIVRSVGPAPGADADADGVMFVDEARWARLTRSARRGLVQWASRCRLLGGSVEIRGADGGADLGRYDEASGLRSSEPDPGP